MANKAVRSNGTAHIVTRVTNPCILSVLMLLASIATSGTGLVKMSVLSLVLLLFLVAVPLVYIYLKISSIRKDGGFRMGPTDYLKHHPKEILVIGIICGLPCWGILVFLGAPYALQYTLAALLITAFITAMINLHYRASFHLAAITVLLVMSAVTWGQVFLIFVVLIPFVGWAKYHIHEHTPAQMTLAIALSIVVTSSIIFLTGKQNIFYFS